MFWKKKNKSKAPEIAPQAAPEGKLSRDQILAQARAAAAAARAEIGDETLDKIKAALLKKQASAIEKAKAQIKGTDLDKVRDHLSLWLEDDKKKK